MSLIQDTPTNQALSCYHCGNTCPDDSILHDDKHFCCEGCHTVYEVLNANNLCQYYALEPAPGQTPQQAKFELLDHTDIASQLLDFRNGSVAKVTFYVPAIHCSSCLWLLENLNRLHSGISHSQVDFLKKQVSVLFRHADVSLRQVAELLTSLGYEPLISLNDVVKQHQRPSYRPLLTRIAVAGFCAGNIMLFSFPEYLGLEDPSYQRMFGYFNLLLSLPVVFYSASGYFSSVWKSLRAKQINIDLPILLGILMAFGRSTYGVLAGVEAGYFDSLTGLVFFLLVGKWFQQRTYDFLSFERDYKSYFPLGVTLLNKGVEESVPVASLRKGDKILVRHHELIPADGLLYKGHAEIDYSFVTGESALESRRPGELVYAGGRQVGGIIEIEVHKEVSQSYLTQLWNNDTFQKNQTSGLRTFADAVGKYFTIVVLTLAVLVAAYWYAYQEPSRALNAFTAILIIACPCALSLSYPFALGNSLRLFGKKGFYLKNAEVIEQLAQCDTIVFDKTGTLTQNGESDMRFEAMQPLATYERLMIAALVHHSTHPLSRQIKQWLQEPTTLGVEGFAEIPGQGIEGWIDGHHLKIGSPAFLGLNIPTPHTATTVHVLLDGQYRGYFSIPHRYRPHIHHTVRALSSQYGLHLLSGDGQAAQKLLRSWFGPKAEMVFHCQPQDKLNFIKKLQAQGRRVVMIGDGLNDAGALKQADVGIAVSEQAVNFTPASDAILEAHQLVRLPQLLAFSQFTLKAIRISFLISLIYNFVGLSYALTGSLSPIVAAILMPLSSATMVIFATTATLWKGKKLLRDTPAVALTQATEASTASLHQAANGA